MVSEDKKGAVLEYEQEHNIIPALQAEITDNPNTQDIHEGTHRLSDNQTEDLAYSNQQLIHKMSCEERRELTNLAKHSTHCYLTMIFSGYL